MPSVFPLDGCTALCKGPWNRSGCKAAPDSAIYALRKTFCQEQMTGGIQNWCGYHWERLEDQTISHRYHRRWLSRAGDHPPVWHFQERHSVWKASDGHLQGVVCGAWESLVLVPSHSAPSRQISCLPRHSAKAVRLIGLAKGLRVCFSNKEGMKGTFLGLCWLNSCLIDCSCCCNGGY